jgi:hypothetical protein
MHLFRSILNCRWRRNISCSFHVTGHVPRHHAVIGDVAGLYVLVVGIVVQQDACRDDRIHNSFSPQIRGGAIKIRLLAPDEVLFRLWESEVSE